MLVKPSLLLLFISFISVSFAQPSFTTGKITDERDGKVYQTIQIDSMVWIAENLKFETPNCDKPEDIEYDLDFEPDGYYYQYQETDLVCPSGFQIPKLSEWQSYVDFLIELKQIPEDSIGYFSHKHGSGMLDNKEIDFFKNPNPLNLSESGLMQGPSLNSDDAINIYSRVEGSSDHKFHLHVTNQGYLNHSHKRGMKGKRKLRKFIVRCVKTIEVE